MDGAVKAVNDLLVELFNDILTIEKAALQQTPFKDLSVTEMHVIEAVGLGSRTMTDVAEDLGITVGTLTTAMNRLVNKEYVSRNRSKEDRRFVEVSLTPQGRLAHRVHERFHEKMVGHMIEELSNEDHEILVGSLQRLGDFFRNTYHIE